MTNELYYGNNNNINNIILNKLNIKKTNIHIYKQFTYEESEEVFIFKASPSLIFIEMISSLIQSKSILNKKHIILIYNIENLTQKYFYNFRILLEKFYNNAIFIATTIKINLIEPAIKSRFFLKKIKIEKEIIITPLTDIKIKPKKEELKKLAYKLKIFELKDICLDILKITPYKSDFIKIAANIDHLYSQTNKTNKELFIELILLEGFYPSNISNEVKKKKI
jgi:hypothetical protein